jgi:hypothetical protein
MNASYSDAYTRSPIDQVHIDPQLSASIETPTDKPLRFSYSITLELGKGEEEASYRRGLFNIERHRIITF